MSTADTLNDVQQTHLRSPPRYIQELSWHCQNIHWKRSWNQTWMQGQAGTSANYVFGHSVKIATH